MKIWSLLFLILMSATQTRALVSPSAVCRKQSTIYGKARDTCSLYSKPKNGELDLLSLENEVMATNRAKMDLQLVTKAFTETTDASVTTTEPAKQALLASAWNVALASAFFTSSLTWFLSTSLFLALVAFVATFFIAYQDPLEEEGVAGPLARVLGRWTIESVETSSPKIRAVARAAITNQEEITQLQSQVRVLEQQNAELIRWKERRLAVEDNLGHYTLAELKEMARKNNIAVGGKKQELMLRLLDVL
jgi:spore coat protein CotF